MLRCRARFSLKCGRGGAPLQHGSNAAEWTIGPHYMPRDESPCVSYACCLLPIPHPHPAPLTRSTSTSRTMSCRGEVPATRCLSRAHVFPSAAHSPAEAFLTQRLSKLTPGRRVSHPPLPKLTPNRPVSSPARLPNPTCLPRPCLFQIRLFLQTHASSRADTFPHRCLTHTYLSQRGAGILRPLRHSYTTRQR